MLPLILLLLLSLLSAPVGATCPAAASPLVEDLRGIMDSAADEPGESLRLGAKLSGATVAEGGTITAAAAAGITWTRADDGGVILSVDEGGGPGAGLGLPGAASGAAEVTSTLGGRLRFEDSDQALAWLDAWLSADPARIAAAAPAATVRWELGGGLGAKARADGAGGGLALRHTRSGAITAADGSIAVSLSDHVRGEISVSAPFAGGVAEGVYRYQRSSGSGGASDSHELSLTLPPLASGQVSGDAVAEAVGGALSAEGVPAALAGLSPARAAAIAAALSEAVDDPKRSGQLGLSLLWTRADDPLGEPGPWRCRVYLVQRVALDGALALELGESSAGLDLTHRELILDDQISAR